MNNKLHKILYIFLVLILFSCNKDFNMENPFEPKGELKTSDAKGCFYNEDCEGFTTEYKVNQTICNRNTNTCINKCENIGCKEHETCYVTPYGTVNKPVCLCKDGYEMKDGKCQQMAWISVTTGKDFTCAINEEQHLFCWGNNNNGQLGTGNFEEKLKPQLVKSPDGTIKHWVSVYAGKNHICGITNFGSNYINTYDSWSYFCWGNNESGELGNPESEKTDISSPLKIIDNFRDNVIMGASGDRYSIMLKGSEGNTYPGNDIYSWGENESGQLGTNNTDSYETPVSVNFTYSDSHRGDLIRKIDAGLKHSCALTAIATEVNHKILDYGDIACWGNNESGQLGTGNNEEVHKNTYILNTDDIKWIDLSVGAKHSCAISSEHKLYCWGDNSFGQLGLPVIQNENNTYNTIQLISDSIKFDSVSAGSFHTCAIELGNGKLYCWGYNQYSQLGVDEFNCKEDRYKYCDIVQPVISDKDGWTMVSAGRSFSYENNQTNNDYTCAIRNNELYCWGGNSHGQLGSGDKKKILNPNDPESKVTID